MKIFPLLILFLLFVSSGFSQKIKKLPAPFGAPISFDSQDDRDAFANRGGSSGKEYWLVMGDRPKVALYSKPNGVQTREFLEFRQTGYVIDESDEWVQIGIGSREDNKFRNLLRSGWVKKTEILLWPKSLRDKNTGITKKGFLLNKLDNVNDILKDHKKVKIYDGPTSTNVIGDKDIYNVYFIYKEEGNRMLIGGTDFINSGTAGETILGWVDNIRVEKWNQRLTLEPNWDPSSYSIRNKDVDKRIYGFSSQSDADLYSKTGSLSKKTILWDNDPASPSFPSKLKSEENENRPKGEVFRFPAFTFTSGYIQSGAINNIPTTKPNENIIKGNISPELLIEMKNKFDKYVAPKRKNINVAFLIEGSEKMESYKPALLAAIENIDMGLPDGVTIRYSAGIYRDANIFKNGWDFSISPMTSDRKKIINYVNAATFNDYTDPDNFTNQRYAIKQMLDKAGFVANQNNILIVIGACADFYYDFGRRESAETQKNKQLIEDAELEKMYTKLTEYDMSMAFLQIENKTGKAYSKFPEDARSLMVNAAQKQYAVYNSIYNNLEEVNVLFPEMPDLEEGNTIRMVNGVGYGIIKRPNRNATFSQKEISDFIRESVKKPFEATDNYYSVLKKAIDGEGILADNIDDAFSPLVWDFISKLSPEAQKKILDDKIKLYTTLYLPIDIQGLHEPYKYVIFMPEAELEDYVAQLRQLERSLNGPSDVIREQLKTTITTLLLKLSGDKMVQKEIDNMDIARFTSLMMGVNLEGIKLDMKGISIKEIMDKKKLSEDALQSWAQTLSNKEKQLSEISRQRSKYPYSYTVGDATYFWLEMSLLDWTEMSKK